MKRLSISLVAVFLSFMEARSKNMGRKVGRKRLNLQEILFYLPLRWVLFPSLFTLFIISSIVILLLFSRAANDSAEKMVSLLLNRIQLEVAGELDSYLDESLLINRENKVLLEHGIIDPYLPEEREPYFSSRLYLWEGAVMSFFGDPDGEFYGARRNEKGDIEVVENNSDTGGASQYYSINSDGRAEEFVIEYPGFDCRTRPWYKAALGSKNAIFSPIYKHFIFDDLAVTASLPVYQENGELLGVLGVDYLLGGINTFLRENRVIEGMVIFIVEDETDYLIANSELSANFILNDQGAVERLRPDESGNNMVAKTYLSSVSRGRGEPVGKDGNLIEHSRYEKENLKWNLYISIPEEPFLTDFNLIGRISIFVIIFFILLTSFLAFFLSRAITVPILNLSDAAEAFVKNRWTSRVPVKGNNEITRLSVAFNTMAAELQGLLDNLEKKVAERTADLNELNKTKDAFFAIIAHDLRGPLSSSSLMLDHLLEEYRSYKPEELEKVIKTIGDSQKSIYHLLENLLLWAQSQRNEVSFYPESCSVDELIREVLLPFKGAAAEKELDFRYEPSGLFVRCDRNMIITVIRNLLSNAVKFSPRGGKIDILCRKVDGEIEISVQDYGTGMDESTLERLHRIENKDTTPGTEGERGTGLGLVITGDFLAWHNRKLEVDSRIGEGSCFAFRLPQTRN